MAFKTNMTTTTQLDAHLLELYDDEFIISAENTYTKGIVSAATIKRAAMQKSFKFTVYSKLSVVTSALTEDTDPTRQQVTDSEVTITPEEYGAAVMRTELANLQSGGVPDLAIPRLVATNMSESIEKLMITTGEAGTNELVIGQTLETSLTASNTMTHAYTKRAMNKLVRVGIPGPYFAIMHDDIIYDIKNESSAWTDINQYSNPEVVLQNEVGMIGGFRVINSPLVTINTDGGSGTVDTYHSQFFGYNAFGYGESQAPEGRLTGPFDALGRFIDIGWYGVYDFALIDTNAHWLVTCASSIGSNS